MLGRVKICKHYGLLVVRYQPALYTNIMKRYIIFDTFNGSVKQTDDSSKAHEFSACEEYFVVDTQLGLWLLPDGESCDMVDI